MTPANALSASSRTAPTNASNPAPYCALQRDFDLLRNEAERLVGSLGDLERRAIVYHHLFRASAGNHAFPLIAAHGALWAGEHFRFGRRLGKWLVWQYAWSGSLRRRKLSDLDDFADAFREINRRVCVDTYAQFYFSRKYRRHPRLCEFVPRRLSVALEQIHDAARTGKQLSDRERLSVFRAHFLHEQETIVGSAVQAALAKLDWPAVKFLALRPTVRFAYLPGKQNIKFCNFANGDERIANGLRAFGAAVEAGWERVEQSLENYGVLPDDYLGRADRYFAALLNWREETP